MEFRVLGGLDVRDRTGRPRTFVRRKQRLLLAGLLLNANQAVPADRIAGWLWTERPPSAPEQNLYNYVSGLRRQLDDGQRENSRIQACSRHYLLRVGPGELDANVFEELVSRGRRATEEGAHATAVEQLTRALGMWRSEVVVDGIELPESLRDEAVRLERLRTVALEAAFDARLALGQHRELVPDLEAAVRRQPLHERLWAQLILALYRSGRQAEAIAGYQEAKRILADELGVEPGLELRRLRRQILESDPSIATPASPIGSSTRPVMPAQLPAVLTSFSGRTDELTELLSAAGGPGAVCAIDGMAGIGKTTLAVEFAHRMADRFRAGQLFVDLHGFTEGVAPVEPSDALERMLRALGVPSERIPGGLDERSALWRTQLSDRRVLIVLDNAMNEAQVRPLLPGGSGCLVLITSRRRLIGLDDVRPLSLDLLPSSDAVGLFIRTVGVDQIGDESTERAAEVVELCGRLPLAIRIAAARLRHRSTWTLAHLSDRLRHEQDRLAELEAGQRSVPAAVRLSYEQLATEQRRMFRLASLHPGPDLEPVAAAALASTTPRRAERLLDDLLDANLLQQHAPGRYRFHDLVRAYATRASAEHDPEAERSKALTGLLDYHAHTALAAVMELYHNQIPRQSHLVPAVAQPTFESPAAAVAWLDAELTNLLAATEQGPALHVLHMSATLRPYLISRAHFNDGEKLHARAHQLALESGDRRSAHEALTSLGLTCLWHGRYATAAAFYERALAIARRIHDRLGEADPLIGLGAASWRTGRLAPAATYFEQALAVARELDHPGGQRAALVGIARICRERQQYERANQCVEQALALAREVHMRGADLDALNCGGDVLWAQGRYDAAADRFRAALRLSREMFDRTAELEALTGLGNTYDALGHPTRARTYHQQARLLAEQFGLRVGQDVDLEEVSTLL